MRSQRPQTLKAYKFSYASRQTFSGVSKASEREFLNTFFFHWPIMFSGVEHLLEILDATEHHVLGHLTIQIFARLMLHCFSSS